MRLLAVAVAVALLSTAIALEEGVDVDTDADVDRDGPLLLDRPTFAVSDACRGALLEDDDDEESSFFSLCFFPSFNLIIICFFESIGSGLI